MYEQRTPPGVCYEHGEFPAVVDQVARLSQLQRDIGIREIISVREVRKWPAQQNRCAYGRQADRQMLSNLRPWDKLLRNN